MKLYDKSRSIFSHIARGSSAAACFLFWTWLLAIGALFTNDAAGGAIFTDMATDALLFVMFQPFIILVSALELFNVIPK